MRLTKEQLDLIKKYKFCMPFHFQIISKVNLSNEELFSYYKKILVDYEECYFYIYFIETKIYDYKNTGLYHSLLLNNLEEHLLIMKPICQFLKLNIDLDKKEEIKPKKKVTKI